MISELQAGRFSPKLTGTVVQRSTGVGSTATDQVAPPGAEMSRAGRRFNLGYSAAPTGIAPAQALATTAAQWTIWNNESAGGKTYFLENIGVFLTSGTPGVGGVLMGCLFTLPATVGAGATGMAVTSASNGGLTSKAIVKSGVTVTAPAAPTWRPLGSNPSPNVGAFPGSATIDSGPLDGKWAIQPQQGLGLYVLALAGTTPLWAPYGNWVELEADME